MPISFSFPYRKQFVYKPIIPITLKHLNQELKTEALLDSGADYSIITSEIMEALGIPIDRFPKKSIKGIGGNIELSKAQLAFKIPELDLSFTGTVYFGRGFKAGINLLGRIPLFQLCKVTFDEKSKKIELVKN